MSKLWCDAKSGRAFSQCQTCEVPLGSSWYRNPLASNGFETLSCSLVIEKSAIRCQVELLIPFDSPWFSLISVNSCWFTWFLLIWRNSCWFQWLHLGQSESSMSWSMTYQDCEVGTVPLWLGSLEMGMVWDGPVNEENLQGKSAAQRDPFNLTRLAFWPYEACTEGGSGGSLPNRWAGGKFWGRDGLAGWIQLDKWQLILENLWISWSCCQTVAFRG